jgi:hypothetical protein
MSGCEAGHDDPGLLDCVITMLGATAPCPATPFKTFTFKPIGQIGSA